MLPSPLRTGAGSFPRTCYAGKGDHVKLGSSRAVTFAGRSFPDDAGRAKITKGEGTSLKDAYLFHCRDWLVRDASSLCPWTHLC